MRLKITLINHTVLAITWNRFCEVFQSKKLQGIKGRTKKPSTKPKASPIALSESHKRGALGDENYPNDFVSILLVKD